MQIFAIVVSLAITVVAVVAVTLAVRRMLGVLRQGQPALAAHRPARRRTVTMLKETLLHTRMLQWHWVGIMHWFVYVGFIVLSASVFTGVLPAVRPRVRAADHRPLLPLRVGHARRSACSARSASSS